MTLTKKGLLFLLLPIFTFVFVGCTNNSDKEGIYDSDELQLEVADSYSYSLRDDESENVANQIDLSFRGFIGRDTIWSLNVSQNTDILLTYDSDLRSGEFKVILITPGNEIHTILTMSDQGTKTITFPEGVYLIKFIGRNAFGSLSMSIETIQGVTINKIEK